MIHFVLCISLLFLSGCWDRKELNDRAIWLATGWDAAENGGVEISGQIVIPANIATQSGWRWSNGSRVFIPFLPKGKM